MKDSTLELRQQMHNLLKKRRVSVQIDALNRLTEFYVTNLENESLSVFVDKIFHLLSLYGSRNTIVSTDVAERIVEDILKDSKKQQVHSTRVIDTFLETPILSLGSDSSAIYLESIDLKILDTPESILETHRLRYRLLLSRALENNKRLCLEQGEPLARFHKAVSSFFTTIQNLNSTDHFSTSLFGILGKFADNNYCLEDETGYVELDFAETCFHDRIYTQGCIVIVRGEWNGKVLRVTHMQMPPLNVSMEPKKLFPGYKCNNDEGQENHIMIIISDIWLDHDTTFNKLEKLLSTMRADNICPDTIVLMGNFLSQLFNLHEDQLLHLRNGFQHLASLLHVYISNEHCQVIILPGPNDPGIGDILPRPPLLDSLLSPLRHSYKCLTAACNPTKLLCQDTTIVLYRDNIQKKLVSQSMFHLSVNSNKIREMMVETMLDQGHLCPLPPDIQPTFWHHEQGLWLFPPPELLVLGCGLEPFQYTYGQTKCFGTGSFALEGFFLVYESTNHNIQICQIET